MVYHPRLQLSFQTVERNTSTAGQCGVVKTYLDKNSYKRARNRMNYSSSTWKSRATSILICWHQIKDDCSPPIGPHRQVSVERGSAKDTNAQRALRWLLTRISSLAFLEPKTLDWHQHHSREELALAVGRSRRLMQHRDQEDVVFPAWSS